MVSEKGSDVYSVCEEQVLSGAWKSWPFSVPQVEKETLLSVCEILVLCFYAELSVCESASS